ncbi:hypothetical protein A0H81_05115 [Grifola frondosa]|uniref:Uncharacterized protein n=1 Tax=Grifola frondosa TaxID=5627 RepID=A0A1C7MC87_GRIFR|nr:hypothetical protein A0H81_05115 [Grifola frondosa]
MDVPPPPWTELPVGPISTGTPYTVIMRNEIFHLSHQQISYDAPNYFTDYFPTITHGRVCNSSSVEARTSPTMDIAVALRNLLLDAQFFGLQGLCDLLMLPNPNVDLVIVGFSNQLISLRNLVQDRLPQSVVYNNGALVSARNKLPVLVFAQDVILRIVIDKVVEAVDEEEVLPHNRTLSFEIDLPSSFTTLAYTDSTCHSYHLAAVATSSEPGGIMHIDGIRTICDTSSHGARTETCSGSGPEKMPSRKCGQPLFPAYL